MSMNAKISGRDVRNGYPVVFVTGYCNWQAIIRVCGWRKVGHAAGYLGWNWDCFEIADNMCLVTGYRSFPKETHVADWKVMEKFEHEAEAVSRTSFEKGYERRRSGFRRRVERYLRKIVSDEAERRAAKRREKEAKDAARQQRDGDGTP